MTGLGAVFNSLLSDNGRACREMTNLMKHHRGWGETLVPFGARFPSVLTMGAMFGVAWGHFLSIDI